MIYKNQQALDRAVALWQKRLRLQDWDITASVIRAADFGRFGMCGACDPDVRNMEVEVMLLDPADYDEHYLDPNYDMEETLVHEMLHIKMARLVKQLPEGTSDDEEETLVKQLARSLVEAYR